MASPSTRAQGQGAAQVFDTSNLANIYGQNVQYQREQEAAKKKALEGKIAELSGMADDVFKEKYFATRDDKYIRGLYNDVQKKYNGKWGAVADPSSPEYLEYKNDLQNLLFEAKRSQESKELAQPFMEAIGKDATQFRPESIEYMNKFLETPGMVFDPTAMRKVNKYSVDEEFLKGMSNYRKQVEDQGTKSFYSKNKDVFGNYDQTKSTDEMENNYMQTFINNIRTNPEGAEKVKEMYGEEAAQLQAQGEDIDEWDLLYRDYKPKLKVDVTKSSFSNIAGEKGKQEPFNPANIVEDIDVKIGKTGEKIYGVPDGWFYTALKDNISQSKMYQTGEVEATIPISKNVIDMETGEAVDLTGTYTTKMGSPLVYKNKLMVPTVIMGTNLEGNYKISALVPAEEVQQQFLEQDGTDLSIVANELKVPFKGTTQTTIPTYSRDEWKKAGWTDAQIEQGIKSGKIKIK